MLATHIAILTPRPVIIDLATDDWVEDMKGYKGKGRRLRHKGTGKFKYVSAADGTRTIQEPARSDRETLTPRQTGRHPFAGVVGQKAKQTPKKAAPPKVDPAMVKDAQDEWEHLKAIASANTGRNGAMQQAESRFDQTLGKLPPAALLSLLERIGLGKQRSGKQGVALLRNQLGRLALSAAQTDQIAPNNRPIPPERPLPGFAQQPTRKAPAETGQLQAAIRDIRERLDRGEPLTLASVGKELARFGNLSHAALGAAVAGLGYKSKPKTKQAALKMIADRLLASKIAAERAKV